MTSGSRFLRLKSNLNYAETSDLDRYKNNELHEFSAKWIEIPKENEASVFIASYGHPSSQDSIS